MESENAMQRQLKTLLKCEKILDICGNKNNVLICFRWYSNGLQSGNNLEALKFEPTFSVNFCEITVQNNIFTLLIHYKMLEAFTLLLSFAAYAGRYQ
jgi:hypothetical protein